MKHRLNTKMKFSNAEIQRLLFVCVFAKKSHQVFVNKMVRFPTFNKFIDKKSIGST